MAAASADEIEQRAPSQIQVALHPRQQKDATTGVLGFWQIKNGTYRRQSGFRAYLKTGLVSFSWGPSLVVLYKHHVVAFGSTLVDKLIIQLYIYIQVASVWIHIDYT